jgi:PAS domain S-box-containing protein
MMTNTAELDSITAQGDLYGVSTSESMERWQTAILAIGRRTAQANPDQLASDAAAALAESLGFDFSGGAAAADDGALMMTLSAARPGVYGSATPLPISERAEDSLVGCALAAGRPIATDDLRDEARYRDALLRTRQIRSALACPLKSNSRVYGALLVASLAPHAFSAQDLLCAETIGHLVAGALGRNRAELLLAEQIQVNAAVFDGVDAIVVTLDAETRLLNINRSCEELTGFKLAEVRQRPFLGAFVAPAAESSVARQMDQLLHDRRPAEFESLLMTKHGAQRRVAWKFARLEGDRGAALVGTGVDVTEKLELEARQAKGRSGSPAGSQAGQATPASKPLAAATAAAVELDTTSEADRRIRPRRAYPYKQRMAAICAGQMPGLNDFREVECNDIGAGGFSYFVAAEPTETDMVVAFGSGASQTYLTARLVHSTLTMHKGQPMYLVGCRYTGRHTYSR